MSINLVMKLKLPILLTAVTDFTVTEERSRVITFSTPLDQIYHAIIIQNPINTYHFEAYTSPFTTTTWSMLFSWIVATPPVLFIVSRYKFLT